MDMMHRALVHQRVVHTTQSSVTLDPGRIEDSCSRREGNSQARQSSWAQSHTGKGADRPTNPHPESSLQEDRAI